MAKSVPSGYRKFLASEQYEGLPVPVKKHITAFFDAYVAYHRKLSNFGSTGNPLIERAKTLVRWCPVRARARITAERARLAEKRKRGEYPRNKTRAELKHEYGRKLDNIAMKIRSMTNDPTVESLIYRYWPRSFDT